ncbi:MAG: TIGR00266 family protein [Candidatus Nephthysia bennettiae]|nr:MAG: TIGR00266 family protein [Candidatus Dormibacteraeota bacterium]
MESKIVGTTMPVLELMLQPNEMVFAESGELAWISMAIQLRTGMSVGGQQGGFMSVLGRAVAGATIFMTEYTALGGAGLVSFCAKLPGQILPLQLEPSKSYLVHRHGFMCGVPGVQLGVGYQQRLGAGIFGGTGFRMQRLSGQGWAWVELHGEVVHYELQAGNTLRVHPGHVALFEDSVDFNVTTMPGIRNALFGGDGLFLATLTGPGRVWLQSMSLSHLAHAIAHYIPSGEGGGIGGFLQGS